MKLFIQFTAKSLALTIPPLLLNYITKPENKSLLEIGCAFGFFVDIGKKFGFYSKYSNTSIKKNLKVNRFELYGQLWEERKNYNLIDSIHFVFNRDIYEFQQDIQALNLKFGKENRFEWNINFD